MTKTSVSTHLFAAALALAATCSSNAAFAENSVNQWMTQHQAALTKSLDAKLDQASPQTKPTYAPPATILPVIYVTTAPAQRLVETPDA